MDGFDNNLRTKAKTINALTMREGNRIESEIHEDSMPEFSDEENPEFFQIAFQDGTVINRSESMEDFDGSVPDLGETLDAIGNIKLEDGEEGRYVLIRTKPINEVEVDEEEEIEEDEIIFEIPASINPEAATVTIFVAKSREDLDQMLAFIFLTIGGIDLLILAGIFLVVRISVNKGLQPIDNINAQIESIDPDDLAKRISLKDPPSELRSIIQTLNELLERMDETIVRERRFTSDVAHELRTPVSELRTACEVGVMSLEDEETTRIFFEDINDVSQQMEKIVSNLLSLSRWDQDATPINYEKVELGDLVRDCWDHCKAEAQGKKIELDCRIDSKTTISTDKEKLQMILQNLLENAVAYSVPGSRIRCMVEPGNPSINLIVENQAANLCREDLRHLFDRFWRKDKARSEVNHSGLGLAIVKALADIMDIEVHPELMDDRWFRMRLKIRI